jgi:hypothetical protein
MTIQIGVLFAFIHLVSGVHIPHFLDHSFLAISRSKTFTELTQQYTEPKEGQQKPPRKIGFAATSHDQISVICDQLADHTRHQPTSNAAQFFLLESRCVSNLPLWVSTARRATERWEMQPGTDEHLDEEEGTDPTKPCNGGGWQRVPCILLRCPH